MQLPPLNKAGEGHLAVGQSTVQAPARLTLEQVLEELLIPGRLERFPTALSQPAMSGGIVHGTEYIGRAKWEHALHRMAEARMVQASYVKGRMVSNSNHTAFNCCCGESVKLEQLEVIWKK